MATNAVTDPGSTSVWRDDRVDPLVLALARPGARDRRRDGARDRDRRALRRAVGARHRQDAQRTRRGPHRRRRLLRGPRPAAARDQAPRPDRHRAHHRRAGALEPSPLRGGPPRARVVLRHVPVVPEPQGLPAVPDRPGLRPGPAVARPQLLLRPRPRPAAPRPARDGRRRAGAVVGLPLLPRVRADLARRGADRVRQPDPRALVRDRARHQLDAGHRLVPDHPVARADLRGARPLLDAAGDRHVRAPAGADLRAPRGAGRRRRAEHRRVRVAARLRRVHGGADRPAAEGQPPPALRAVDVPRPDDGRHAVLRLALRRRRPRGPR